MRRFAPYTDRHSEARRAQPLAPWAAYQRQEGRPASGRPSLTEVIVEFAAGYVALGLVGFALWGVAVML